MGRDEGKVRGNVEWLGGDEGNCEEMREAGGTCKGTGRGCEKIRGDERCWEEMRKLGRIVQEDQEVCKAVKKRRKCW